MNVNMHKEISRSVRYDYRIHVERSIEDIEKAEIVGNTLQYLILQNN